MMRHSVGPRDSNRERGANLVELALILPFLLLLIAAIADFGRAFNSYIVINNAAREGARYGGRVNHTDVIDTYILNAVYQEAENSGLDLRDPTVATITIEPAWNVRPANTPMTVTVDYTMTTFFTGIVGLDRIPMRSQSVMVMYGSTQVAPAP